MRISDWSSDVCSSDLICVVAREEFIPECIADLLVQLLPAQGIFVASWWGRHGDFSVDRSEEHTSELQSLMRNSYAVFCLKQKKSRDENNPTRHFYTQLTYCMDFI